MGWNKKGSSSWIFILAFVLVVVGISMGLVDWGSGDDCEYEYIGIIKEFDVSAGGFLSPSMCKIELLDGRDIVASGRVCYDLFEGETIEKRIESKKNIDLRFCDEWRIK